MLKYIEHFEKVRFLGNIFTFAYFVVENFHNSADSYKVMHTFEQHNYQCKWEHYNRVTLYSFYSNEHNWLND